MQNLTGHSYLGGKNSRAKLFCAKKLWHSYFKQKLLGHSYKKAKNDGPQLFRVRNYLGTAIYCHKIMGHSYLVP